MNFFAEFRARGGGTSMKNAGGNMMKIRPSDRAVSEHQMVRRARRLQRHWRRRLAEQDMIPSNAAKWCQTAAGNDVEVALMLSGDVHVSGVKRCGSPWCCPVCAPVSRERRAEEVLEFGQWVLEQGGRVQMLTVTMQHSAVEDPKKVVADLQLAWSKMWNSDAATTFRRTNGMIGKVRAIEFTYGRENGWHPHIHALLFYLPPRVETPDWWHPPMRMQSHWSEFVSFPTAAETRRFATHAWSQSVFRHTGRNVSRRVGVDVTEIEDIKTASDYITEGGWQVGRELARNDLKKSAGRWSPYELLARAATTNDPWATSVWCAFESMTYGLRFLQWDPGLRKRFGFAEEMSDEEAMEVLSKEVEVHRTVISREVWFAAWRSGREAELIEQVEREWWAKQWQRALHLLRPLARSSPPG